MVIESLNTLEEWLRLRRWLVLGLLAEQHPALSIEDLAYVPHPIERSTFGSVTGMWRELARDTRIPSFVTGAMDSAEVDMGRLWRPVIDSFGDTGPWRPSGGKDILGSVVSLRNWIVHPRSGAHSITNIPARVT